jgi:hypothetical protein
MSAGPRYSSREFVYDWCVHHDLDRYEYLWEDGTKYKRPTKLSAPEYVDTLMNWAQSLLDNEEYFPNQIGV